MNSLNPENIAFPGATFAYRAVFTQSNAAGGAIDIRFKPGMGAEFLILSIIAGPDNYAAGRSITARILDEDGNRVRDLAEVAGGVDNILVPMIRQEAAAPASSEPQIFASDWDRLVSGDDEIQIKVSTPVQNETFTVAFRLRLLGGQMPSVDSSNSAGTVGAPTVTINRMI